MYKPEGDPIQIRYFERRAQEIVGSGLSSCRQRSPRGMPRERRLALIERLGAWGMLDRYHLFHAARADITAGATQIGAEPELF